VLERPYEDQVALWLNLPRVQLRAATVVALGAQMGLGGQAPGREVADALAATDAEAAELLREMRLAAREAGAKRRWGF
jgi:hypothetical protein